MSEKLYTVLTPNEEFTGYRNGLKTTFFQKGKARVTKKEAIVFMRNFGYSCPELEKKAEEPETEATAQEEPAAGNSEIKE